MTWNDLVQIFYMYYDPAYDFWATMPRPAQIIALLLIIAILAAIVKIFEKIWNWATD